MRLTLTLALCLVMFSSIARGAVTPAAISAAQVSTVIVFGNLSEESFGYVHDEVDVPFCSGVDIGRRGPYEMILTARHCVHRTREDRADNMTPTPMRVKFNDGTRYLVMRYEYAPHDDIGVLLIPATGRAPAIFSTQPIERGGDYFVFGMPNGYPWSYVPATSMQGSQDSRVAEPWKTTILVACPACGPGDSGGGLFDANGTLLGIAVANDGAVSAIVPLTRIEYALAHTLLPVSGVVDAQQERAH